MPLNARVGLVECTCAVLIILQCRITAIKLTGWVFACKAMRASSTRWTGFSHAHQSWSSNHRPTGHVPGILSNLSSKNCQCSNNDGCVLLYVR